MISRTALVAAVLATLGATAVSSSRREQVIEAIRVCAPQIRIAAVRSGLAIATFAADVVQSPLCLDDIVSDDDGASEVSGLLLLVDAELPLIAGDDCRETAYGSRCALP